MKFVRYTDNGVPRWGRQIDDTYVQELLADPNDSRSADSDPRAMSSLSLLAPCAPSKIVAVGLNYLSHAEELGKAVPSEPLLFLKPPSSQVAHLEKIHIHHPLDRTDYEAELAIVIGRRCKNLSKDSWPSVVLGYTCANDVTNRTIQRRDVQYTRSKGFDTFCPLGPTLATGVDPDDLELSCSVNGEVRQMSRTSDLIFSVGTLLCFISSVMTLEAGDVVLTGTPAGVGPLCPGDEVVVEIEDVGVLRNYVVAAGS